MKTTIKKALNTFAVDGSIFQYLPIYGEDMTARKMGIAYVLQHSGSKLTSNFLDAYIDNSGHVSSAGMEEVGEIITAIFKDSWDRKWEALTVEYNPIENYNRIELTEDSHMGSDTENLSFGAKHAESVGKVKGYNAATFSEAEKTETDSRASEDGKTNTYGSSMLKDSVVHGNIGVLTNQSMITDEVKMRNELNFYNSVFDDIDSYIALHVYCSKEEASLISTDITIEDTEHGAIITINGQSVEIKDGKTPILDLRENGDLYVDYEEV